LDSVVDNNNQFLPEFRYEYNGKKAINQISEIISTTTETLESVFDYNWLNILVEHPLFFNILEDFKLKQKGIVVRFITTITPENISNCTKLMKFVELRHTDAIIGYLGISDRKQFFNYIPPISRDENYNNEKSNNKVQLNLIHITNKNFIQMQHIFFEKLWESSIPANEKIAQIKRIMFDNTLLNTNIRDLSTIKRLIPKVIQSAVEEILLFFPTINSFWLIEENNGIIGLLSESIDRYIKVKMIVQIDNSEDSNANKKIDQKIKKASKVLGTYVNYTTTKKIDTKTILLIADQAISLSISIKEDHDKNKFKDAIELASFSNNKINVSTLLSLFDSIWIRTEIDKQNIIKQTYFKIFKEPQLRDEKYRRKWLFEYRKDK
jgi:hypothetical protein